MANQMDKSVPEKTDRQQKSTHLNDPTHRDLNAHGIQEQNGEFDADLDTFDDLNLHNRRDTQSEQKNADDAQKTQGAKLGRGQIPQDKKSSPIANSNANTDAKID